MNRLASVIVRVGLGLMVLCTTLASTGSSASAGQEKYVQLESGYSHTCVLSDSGTVKCWGRNYFGQLGLGYVSKTGSQSVNSATLVPGLTDVVSIASGYYHMCALLNSGSVKCWGNNGDGQLGLGYISPTSREGVSSPTVVPDLTDVASLALGNRHSCAVLTSGSVKCWGYNEYGDLGLGYNSPFAPYGSSFGVSSPTLVPGLTDVSSISAGFHSCALLTSGSVKCWGYNGDGELGLGYSGGSVSSPSLVPGLSGVTSIDLGFYHTCAALVSGSVKCWGYNYTGQLGLGYYSNHVSSPTLVPGLTEVTDVALAGTFSCALLVSREVKCWATKNNAALGLGDTNTSSWSDVWPITLVPGLTDVVSLVGGGYHTCALTISGSVRCWGDNDYGQVGLGYISQYVSSPTLVPGVASDEISVAPKTIANAPVITSVVAGNRQATVNFTGPTDNGGANITNFEYSVNSGSSWTTVSPAQTSASLVITGLSNGIAYGVKIRAVNAAGSGMASNEVGITPRTIANAPVITSAVAGNGSAVVTFTAASDDGGSAIIGYLYSLDNGQSWMFGSASPLVIRGLTNGITYSVKVRALNGVGFGDASEPVTVSLAKAVPAKPVVSSVVAGNASATVKITTPTDVTAQSITGYQYSIDNGVTYQNAVVSNGSFTIDGLTNGVSTTVQIRALNINGNSVPSNALTVVPVAPALPTNWVASTSGVFSIGSTAPSTGASVLTSFQYSLDGGVTWLSPKTGLQADPFKASGVPRSTPYPVKIRAANRVFTVSVASPINNGGGPITGYAYSVDNGQTWTPVGTSAGYTRVLSVDNGKTWKVVSTSGSSTRVLIDGLKSDMLYPVQIAAIRGTGTVSGGSNLGTPR